MDEKLLDILRGTSFFGAMETSMLREIMPLLTPVSLPAGERLIREGEIGDCCYVLIRGRLSVVVNADNDPLCVGEIGHGEVVGELALLSEAPRSATVFALRDSELLRMGKDTFRQVLERNPDQLLAMVRLLARRTQERQSHAQRQQPPVRVGFLVAPGSDLPVAELTGNIQRAFSERRRNLVVRRADLEQAIAAAGLTGCDQATLRRFVGHWLEERDDDATLLLFPDFEATPEAGVGDLLEALLLEADRLVMLAHRDADPASLLPVWDYLTRHPSLSRTRRDLALLRPRRKQLPEATDRWIAQFQPDRTYHLAADQPESLSRMARRIMGHGTGLVLGGGGARGFAHVGVFKAFEELRIPVDMVGGTSIGSCIGMLKAMDLDAREIGRFVKAYFKDDPTNDYTIPFISLIAGRKIDRRLERFFRDRRLEDMPIPGYAVATNLTQSCPMVLDKGLARRAVRASLAIPGVLPPMAIDGDIAVDGGVSNNLPVNVMRQRFSGRIVAVDVASGYSLQALKHVVDRPLKRRDWLSSRLRRVHTGVKTPGLAEVLLSVGSYAGINSDIAGRTEADVLISPDLKSFGLLDWDRYDDLVERGYRAAMETLEKLDLDDLR